MKHALIVAAAALVALPGAAGAKTKTTTIAFDGYCDVVTINVTGTAVAGKDACAGGFGGGLIVKPGGAAGKAIVAGVQFSPYPGYQFVLQLSYPLVTGGSWTLSYTTDGASLNPYESGTYTVQAPPYRDQATGKAPAVRALLAR